ncbi:MAG: aminomethyltransferase beta-barrel domain-containing protein [Oscillospiraceae bacterium]
MAPLDGGVKITGETAFRAPTPGQLAVFYRGEVVVGSGWIE